MIDVDGGNYRGYPDARIVNRSTFIGCRCDARFKERLMRQRERR